MSDRTANDLPGRSLSHRRWAAARRILKLIFLPVAIALAILYFLIDAIVLSLVLPVAHRVAAWPPIARFMRWAQTLGPYPTAILVLVPIVLLEPLKPAAFFLMAKHRVAAGTVLLVATEIVKIVAVERLFRLCHAKLMQIPAFARVYTFAMARLAYLETLPPWQLALRITAQVKTLSRRMVAAVRDLAS
jgi:hypothetical protein